MGVLLNFDLKGANIKEKPDYYQRLIDNGLRLDVKNEKANCFKVNIYDGDILTATFLTEKQHTEREYDGVMKKVGMTKDEFINSLKSNTISGFTANQFIYAVAQTDCYLQEKEKELSRIARITDLTNGIMSFHLREVKEAVAENALPDLIKTKAEDGIKYLTGEELSNYLEKDNINKYNNFILLDMSSQSTLIIQEKYGVNGIEYAGIMMTHYEEIRKFAKVPEIAAIEAKALYDVLNPKIEEYKEKVEQEAAEINKPKNNIPTPFSKPTPY